MMPFYLNFSGDSRLPMSKTLKAPIVVMGGTMGTGTFKPEKNLGFFQDKKSRYP